MQLTDEMIEFLTKHGLTKIQAQSKTAALCAEYFMPDDAKLLIAEAAHQVEAMRAAEIRLKRRYDELEATILNSVKTVQGIVDAQNEYGPPADEKAHSALALYAALLNMNLRAGCSPDRAVDGASFPVYAFLGGQATRNIVPYDDEAHNQENIRRKRI